nr:5-oxoprolinase subunit PxpB [Peribacillus alkalitolerans]
MNGKLYQLGDAAVIVQLGNSINLETHQRVKALVGYLEQHPFTGMIEYVPAFTTVTIFYDPVYFYGKNQFSPYQQVCTIVEGILSKLEAGSDEGGRLIEIPVCYGGSFGSDLDFVAESNGLTTEEVIRYHTSGDYLVYMIGFAPGFPYIGGMSERIATPRRSSPRLAIPAGSVGIAGKQTGVYPIETPGGWQLIGRTPLALFRPNASSPSLLQAGDRIRFSSITEEEYLEMKEGQE